MNEYEIYKAVMDDVAAYTGKKSWRAGRYEIYPYPQKLGKLSDLIWGHTLREKGDIKKYLKLQKAVWELEPAQARKKDQKLYKIIEWLDRSIDAIATESTNESNILVISMLVFGKDFLDRMLNYNFKSLLALENIPCLAVEKRVVMYLQTDEKSKQIIEEAETTKKMKSLGVHFDYAIIPDDVINILNEENTYWLLGACASLSVHYAKSLKADYHHSYPDAIYSERFFSELLRLAKTHKSILGQGTRADESLLAPKLLPYLKQQDRLSIPAADLMALHLNCIHQVAWPLMVNNREKDYTYPVFHVHIWETEDYCYLHCPHLMAYWIKAEVLKELPTRFYMTFDSELDLVCPAEDYYIPQEGDDLYMADLSAPDRNAMADVYSDALEVSYRIWTSILFRDVLKFFFRGMKVKINRSLRPIPKNVISEGNMWEEKVHLFNTLLATDPYRNRTFARKRTHVGYNFKKKELYEKPSNNTLTDTINYGYHPS